MSTEAKLSPFSLASYFCHLFPSLCTSVFPLHRTSVSIFPCFVFLFPSPPCTVLLSPFSSLFHTSVSSFPFALYFCLQFPLSLHTCLLSHLATYFCPFSPSLHISVSFFLLPSLHISAYRFNHNNKTMKI